MTNNQSTPPSMYSRGGIDQQIQDGMNRSGNNPAKAKETYGKSGDVKDLLVWQKLANTFKEIDKATALAGNGSPPTLMDSLPQEVMGRMTGTQNQGDRVQGVAGVLQNQQRQQQQMQGQPQGQPMRAAMGGIINAPAPNLNRMYNGGIVGYAGPDGSEVSSLNAYLKRLGIDPSRVKDATDAELANIKAAVEREMQKDRDKGAGLLRESLQGLSVRSEAKRLDDDERAAAEGKPLRGEAAINPPADDRNVREAERLRGLKSFEDTDYVNEGYYNINDQGSLDSYLATMEDPKFGAKGKDQFAQGAPNIAGGLDDFAKYPKFNKKPEPVTPPLSEQDTQLDAAASAIGGGASVVDSTGAGAGAGGTTGAGTAGATTGAGAPIKKGIAGIKPSGTVPLGGLVPQQSPRMTPLEQERLAELKAEATKDIKDTPEELTGSAAIQAKLDAMGGKKGIAGLIQLAANTNFQPSYGGTGAALASAGRDIAKTGRDEKARERKFLEDQLAVQQAIEAKRIEAAEATRQYDATLGQRVAEAEQQEGQFVVTEERLTESMKNLNARQMEDLSLRTRKATFDSLAKLKELKIAGFNSEAAIDYKKRALALQVQANQYKQDGNIIAMNDVVEGYVRSATRFYEGLLDTAETDKAVAAIRQELNAEKKRLSKMLGAGNTINLNTIYDPDGGAAPDSGFSGFVEEE